MRDFIHIHFYTVLYGLMTNNRSMKMLFFHTGFSKYPWYHSIACTSTGKGCFMKPCGTFYFCLLCDYWFWIRLLTVTAPTKPNISKPLHLSTQSFYWKHFDLPFIFGDFSLNGAVLYWTWFKSFCLTSYVCDACRRRRVDILKIFLELNEGVSSP